MVTIIPEKLDYARSVFAGRVDFAGGGTTLVIDIPGIKPESFPVTNIESTTSMFAPYIASSIITTDTLTVTFSADPGTSVISYLIALDQA